MQKAYLEAQKAAQKGEVPIGAVVVKDGKIIARGHNLREIKKNALCHAELIALDKACKKLGGWRLIDCDLYVTLEPCPMCAGAIIQSRIRHLYFGASDAKSGAVGSVVNLLSVDGFNHSVDVTSGILSEQCSEILSDFFRNLRKFKKMV
ncbi:MAG: nucleoside deaminase [Hyphomonadaceae bacterium]|nr:nucleoside deaminase [Clostridia bacterium]